MGGSHLERGLAQCGLGVRRYLDDAGKVSHACLTYGLDTGNVRRSPQRESLRLGSRARTDQDLEVGEFFPVILLRRNSCCAELRCLQRPERAPIQRAVFH